MTKTNNNNWIVLKFGGTSVATPREWLAIATIVRERLDEGFRPVLVCSALASVSDKLEQLLHDAPAGNHAPLLEAITEQHRTLASELDVSFDELSEHLDELGKLAQGIALTREVSPRIHAKVLALGEMMSTRLGAAFLNKHNIPTEWHDARTLLCTNCVDTISARSFLSASCTYERDNEVQQKLAGSKQPVAITQGFIARNSNDDTVLLGRGGSDVSASYLAAKLGADRFEMWTNVPGMYTANPHRLPTARLIKSLNYDEAQEIASTGAKVVHPRCIYPLRHHGIPLHIKCMNNPHLEGTVISSAAANTAAQIKAISSKPGVTIVSLETINMWHQSGFLADAFTCFKNHGISVDLVSTSETNVTVTLDRATNALDRNSLNVLTANLGKFCQVRVIENCAFVSLVGKNIRSILHQLGSALEVFEEQKIYLVTQASNDLNLTFVVDEDQAERLVQKLHAELFSRRTHDTVLGATWKDQFEKAESETHTRPTPWWQTRADELLELAKDKSPRYVYDEGTILNSIERLTELSTVDRLFYSTKANPHPDILRTLYNKGFGFECVSPGEVEHVFRLFPDIDPQRVLFTPNFASRRDYERGLEHDVIVTLDNLFPLEAWPEIFRDRDLFVRMDPGRGKGHHKYVHTAGTKSKFGVPSTQIDEFAALANKCGARVVGLHAHVGSSIFAPDTWSETAQYLAEVAKRFPHVTTLDLGGGLGVVEKPGQDEIDMAAVNENLQKFKTAYPQFKIWIEPGRFVVAESGVLLASVTQTKHKGDYRYVGIDAGMNALIRPALYGSYHEIVNLSRLNEPHTMVANIVGPICETGDVLGNARSIAPPQEGDVMLIATTGAYGRVMSSTYNLRELVAEHFLPVQTK